MKTCVERVMKLDLQAYAIRLNAFLLLSNEKIYAILRTKKSTKLGPRG
jgi:hypothetical protein